MRRFILAGLSTVALSTALVLPATAVEQSISQAQPTTVNKQADAQDDRERQEAMQELDQMFEKERQEMMSEMNARLDRMHQEMVRIFNQRFEQLRQERLNR